MSRRRKTIILAVKLAISIGLIWYLVSTYQNAGDIVEQIQNADVRWIAFAILLMVPNLLIQSLKWYLLIRRADARLNYWTATGSTIGSMALGFLTPGRIGEMGKALFLRHVDKWQITGLAFFDRIVNMIAITFWGMLAFVIIFIKLEISPLIYLTIVLLVFLAMIVSIDLIIHSRFVHSVYDLAARTFKWGEATKAFIGAVRLLNRRTVIYLLLLSLLLQAIIGFQFVLMINAFDASLAFGDGMIASFATAVTKAVIPISIADIGVRETAADYFFQFYMTNRVAILNGSFSLLFVNVVFPAMCGLFMLPKLNFQRD